MSRLKDIPELARDGNNINAVMASVREALQTFRGYRGDPKDQALTLRDLSPETQRGLLGGGLISGGIAGGTSPFTAGSAAVELDLTPPPTPEGLTVGAAISHIFVECAVPVYLQGHGHDRTVVYGAKWPDAGVPPTFSDTVELFRFYGLIGAYPSDPSTRWAIWIKWLSSDGVLSTDPAGGTNGVVVTTGQDVSALVSAMTGPGNPFTVLTAPTVIDGRTFPAGTYSTNAFIQDAQITTAKIANLAVDDAKIASLSAAKITAGAIGVGSYIQSTNFTSGSEGWKINADGTAELANAVVRGGVYASYGQIGGITIASNAVRAGQTAFDTGTGFYFGSNGTFSIGNSAGAKLTWNGSTLGVVGDITGSSGTFSGSITGASGTFGGNVSGGQFTTGAYTGYAWPAAGNYGSYLGPSGLLIGNANNGTYLQVEANGNLYAPGFTVVNGTLTINQANVISALNIAGNSATAANTASGTAPSTTLYIPPYSTAKITAIVKVQDSPTYNDISNVLQQNAVSTISININGNVFNETGVISAGSINDNTVRVFRRQSSHMYQATISTGAGGVNAGISVTQSGSYVPATSNIFLTAFALFR